MHPNELDKKTTNDGDDNIEDILEKTPPRRSEIINLLLSIQQRFGYLSSGALRKVARHFCISETDVWSVATFYNEFRFTPRGKYYIKVCLGTACHIKGGASIMKTWETKLKINEGGITPDKKFSLDRVGCVGCCSMAPVAVVNEKIEGKMSPVKVEGILLKIKLDEEKNSSTK